MTITNYNGGDGNRNEDANDNDRMHFSNVDGSDGGRAPDPDNDGSNTGKYEGRKKIRPATSVGTRTTSKRTIP